MFSLTGRGDAGRAYSRHAVRAGRVLYFGGIGT